MKKVVECRKNNKFSENLLLAILCRLHTVLQQESMRDFTPLFSIFENTYIIMPLKNTHKTTTDLLRSLFFPYRRRNVIYHFLAGNFYDTVKIRKLQRQYLLASLGAPFLVVAAKKV